MPIVLIHDSLDSVALWREFLTVCTGQTGRTVIAYDRLGFGQSNPSSKELSQEFVARKVGTSFDAVLRSMGIDRFILCGHSIRDGMAVHCAINCGDTFLGLIIESVQMSVEDRTIQGIEQTRERFKNEDQIERLRKFHGDKTEWMRG